jgi:hypothetical protein
MSDDEEIKRLQDSALAALSNARQLVETAGRTYTFFGRSNELLEIGRRVRPDKRKN